MQLKVFKLKDGKLVFAGSREVRTGDAILEGATSMSEISPGELGLGEVELHESMTPTGKEIDAAAKAIRDRQGKEGLANSYRQSHPGATDAEVAAFCQGRNPEPSESLDDALRRAHPDWSQAAIDAFKRGR